MALFAAFLFSIPCYAKSFADYFHSRAPHKMPPLVFEDQNGTQHALGDERGHYVLLNIWATWCVPCVQEMPSLDALQMHFDRGKLVIIPLSEDHGDAVVTSFYRVHNVTRLPVALDHAGTAVTALGLHGLPTTLLIDPQGNEIGRIEGNADWSAPEVIAFLSARIN